jgi:hypothetical protein
MHNALKTVHVFILMSSVLNYVQYELLFIAILKPTF